jgi:hypothetical protein
MIHHMDEHDAAVQATGERMLASQAIAAHDHDEHLAAVMAALKAEKRPTDVASHSPFSAAYLRKLARLHGIPRAVKRARGAS